MNKFIGIIIIIICFPFSLYFLHRCLNNPSTELFSTLTGVLVGVFFMLYLYFKMMFKPKK